MVRTKNILISALFQMIEKTSHSLAVAEQDNVLIFLRDSFALVNKTIENAGIIYSDLQPNEAQKEITTLDNLYFALDKIIDVLITELDESEKQIILPEYNQFIDNIENIREGLELYTNPELMKTLKDVSIGDYSDYVKIA